MLKEPRAARILFDSWHPYAWLAVACLIFLPTLFFSLTLLDDYIFMRNMLGFLRDFSHFKEIWQRDSLLNTFPFRSYYRPLIMFTFMVDAHNAGESLLSFRITNIVLHWLSSCLVHVFMIKAGYSRGRSGILSLAFAVHPLLTQAVAWVPGRTETLLAAFLLSSFICFMDLAAQAKWRLLFWHLLFFAAALLTKELAVVLPLACLLYVWITAKTGPPRRSWLVLISGWLGVGWAWHAIRAGVLKSSPISYSLPGMIKSCWSNLPALFVYLGKMLFPINLSTYPILQDSRLFYGIAALAASATAIHLSKHKNWRRVLWGFSWLLLFLLPSFVYPDAKSIPVFFEYRAYLPLIGFLVILAETDLLKTFDCPSAKTIYSGLSVVVVLALLTFLNLRNYRDSLAYWRSAVAYSPHSAFAHAYMALNDYIQGNKPAADKESRRAVELDAREPMAHYVLCMIHMDSGRLAAAKAECFRELEIDPYHGGALNALGSIAYKERNFAQAQALWMQAIRYYPDDAEAYSNLALFYYSLMQVEQARHLVQTMRTRGLAPPAQLENLK